MNYTIDYYNDRIRKANDLKEEILTEYENDCPPTEGELKKMLHHEVYKIPFLDAKYKRKRAVVQKELTLAQRFHAKVTLLAKDYYGNYKRHDKEDYEQFGWTELFAGNITPQERQTYIDADPIYQSVTVWMATHNANLELVNDNIKSLTERGRQFRTAMEHIRFNNGEL